jgi:hypothetical protein
LVQKRKRGAWCLELTHTVQFQKKVFYLLIMSLEAFDFKYLFELQIVFLEFSVPYYWVKTGHCILKI